MAVNQANVTWGKDARTAQANAVRLADTAANRKKLQDQAKADQVPSAVVDLGQDVVLLSGAALQTASRIARTQSASIAQGDKVKVEGAEGTVLTTDDGFAEVDTKDVIVAIIDSGLDVNHPAFAGRIVSPHNMIDNSSDVTDEVEEWLVR